MRTFIINSIVATLAFSGFTQAYTLETKNSTSVIFQLDGNPVTNGQEFFVVDENNKPKLQVKVEKFNSKQAKAKIIKGNVATVQAGWILRPTRAPANVPESSMSAQAPSIGKGKNSWGLLGGYNMASMNAKFSYNGTNQAAAMSGSSMNFYGYYDYTFNRNLQFRAIGGMETFDSKVSMPTNVCAKGASAECNVKIGYLSMYGMGKYILTKTKNRYWIGGGLGYLLASSKSSSVLDTSLISSNQVLTIGGGVDIGIGKNTIPVSLDYSLFPSSPTVSASVISLKFGWGFDL